MVHDLIKTCPCLKIVLLFHPKQEFIMTGQGSAGNVIAALASFFIPGLGQLIQGRPFAAMFFFIGHLLLWLIFLGWVFNLLAALNAAWYQP